MLRRMALLAATNSADVVVTTGLVLHLDAGNTASYPGSGPTWTDLSGNGNNGTISGATYDSISSGAISFNRSSFQYVSLGDPAGLRFGTGDWSLEVWMRANSYGYGGQESIMLASKGAAGFEIFWTDPSNQGGRISRFIANQLQQYGTSSDWSASAWYQVVICKTSGVYSIYKNAVPYASFSNSSNVSNIGINWYLGNRQGGGVPVNALIWDGYISIARMYSKGLTASEVSQNFNANRGRYGI